MYGRRSGVPSGSRALSFPRLRVAMVILAVLLGGAIEAAMLKPMDDVRKGVGRVQIRAPVSDPDFARRPSPGILRRSRPISRFQQLPMSSLPCVRRSSPSSQSPVSGRGTDCFQRLSARERLQSELGARNAAACVCRRFRSGSSEPPRRLLALS